MIVTRTISDCRAQRAKLGALALVPTMGALHEGHITLIRRARQLAPHVAVSIFVNPTQFGPSEDFSRYPRPIENDLALCRDAGVDLVFNPEPPEMYPPGLPEVAIDLPQLAQVLEGEHRPTHFRGVCQVVAKLFNIVQPQVACFGEKDFQQLSIITAMVRALDFPIQIEPCPTHREPDGLAMSSRNRYLSPPERQRALSISRGLLAARDAFAQGQRAADALVQLVRQALVQAEPAAVPTSIDYVALTDAATLRPLQEVSARAVLAVAMRVGATRLIDNIILDPAHNP
jgi:pantoate--beta-alanine ligase